MEMQAEAERKKRAQVLESEGSKVGLLDSLFFLIGIYLISQFFTRFIIYNYIILFARWTSILIGERQANINIADGRKSAVILASEAAKMDQVNRALG